MNPDDRFDAYFADRTPDVPVPSLGSTAVVDRARRRRTRRNGAKVAAVLGVLAIGGAVVAQSADRGEQRVASGGNAVVPSPLDWTLVTATSGLGSSSASATTDDGAIYDLSTAPGVPDPEGAPTPAHLYRSGDGTEWTSVDLPGDLAPLGLAAGGDRLYAVGTAPAGGGTEAVQVAAGDGDGTWDLADVPLDLAELGTGFPGEVGATGTSVATGPDGTVVVSVDVEGQLAEDALPEGIGRHGWRATTEGIEVLDDPCRTKLDDAGAPVTTAPATTAPATTAPAAADPTTTVLADPQAGDREKLEEECGDVVDDPSVEGLHPWSELGVDPEAGRLALGRTYLFASAGGAPFQQVADLELDTWSSRLLGSADGWWLLWDEQADPTSSPSSTARAAFSADGRTWSTDTALELPGTFAEAGLMAGRPTVATYREGGSDVLLNVLAPSGVRTIDVAAAVGSTGADGGVADLAFGPLGFAVLRTRWLGDDATRSDVVHTADGSSFSVEDVPGPEEGRSEGPRSIAVSADAITVRLNSYPAGLSFEERTGVAPTQRLFVGTPA